MANENSWLSELLCCPFCRGELSYQEEPRGYICYSCSNFYPYKGEILSFIEFKKLDNEKNSVDQAAKIR